MCEMIVQVRRYLFLIGLLLSSVSQFSECYRILGIFPHPGRSHFVFFEPLMLELARKGHDVTVFSFFQSDDKPDNYQEFIFTNEEPLTNSFEIQDYVPNFYRDAFITVSELTEWGRNACPLMLNDYRLNKIVEGKEKYDLTITEHFHTDCALGLAHVMNVPLVGLSSCVLLPWHYDRLGMPDSPSFIPSHFVGFSEEMSLSDRIVNYFYTKTTKIMYKFYQEIPDNQMLRERFGKDFPDVQLLRSNISLILLNQHYSIVGSRPLPANVIEVGGLHLEVKKKSPLKPDLQNLVRSSKNGVILMSYGSVVALSTLPEDKRKTFFNVFAKLSQTVILKWESDKPLPDKPDNVHLVKWLPQRELLKEENVKLFITHGGMMGMIEATHAGVPMVVSPFYGDQYHNAATLAHRKGSVLLNYDMITETSLFEAIQKCLSKEYQDQAQLLALYLNNRPKSPLETAIWAVEHVIETGGNHFAKPHSIKLNWITRYSLDAISIILLTLIAIILILKRLLTSILEALKCRKVKTE